MPVVTPVAEHFDDAEEDRPAPCDIDQDDGWGVKPKIAIATRIVAEQLARKMTLSDRASCIKSIPSG